MKHLPLLVCLLFCSTLTRAELQEGQPYRISPVSDPTRCLFPRNADLASTAAVVLWTQTGVPAEQWTLAATGNYFTLQNGYTGHYLNTGGSTFGLTLKQNKSASAARWRLEAVDEAAGIYRLLPTTGTYILDAGTSSDGGQPTLARKDGASQSQLWQFTPVEAQAGFTPQMQAEMIDDYLTRFLQWPNSRRATFIRGSWGESEQLEVLLDAYEGTGDEQYLTDAVAVYNYFVQNVGADWLHLVYTDTYKWYGHDFNDDVMWQIIATARLGWLTGESKYTTAARRNFDAIYERAYIPFTGLMRWAENSGDAYGTNSCIAGPTEVAACYLGMSGAGESYFEKARDLYAAQRYSLADMQTGQVYDAVVWDSSTRQIKSRNNWASTYNQGTMLGAACLLYRHYGDEQYKSDAELIMDYTRQHLCESHGIVNACQVNDGDLCGFKGILMRYVRRFVLDTGHADYKEWLVTNAQHAYNNRSPHGVTTSAWLTKSTDETATNAFSCSTAAAAAAAVIFDDETGIRDLQGCRPATVVPLVPAPARHFNLLGAAMPWQSRGLHLISHADGSVQKALVR